MNIYEDGLKDILKLKESSKIRVDFMVSSLNSGVYFKDLYDGMLVKDIPEFDKVFTKLLCSGIPVYDYKADKLYFTHVDYDSSYTFVSNPIRDFPDTKVYVSYTQHIDHYVEYANKIILKSFEDANFFMIDMFMKGDVYLVTRSDNITEKGSPTFVKLQITLK